MDNTEINLEKLSSDLAEKPLERVVIDRVPLLGNEHKFTKVAFDLWKAECDNSIWEVATVEGKEYLVKRPESLSVQSTTETKSAWKAKSAWDKKSTEISLGNVIVSNVAFPGWINDKADAEIFSSCLVSEINKNRAYRQHLLANTNEATQTLLIKQALASPQDNQLREAFAAITANRVSRRGDS